MSEDIDLRNLVANVAAAYFKNSHVTPTEIPMIIKHIAASLSALGAPAVELPPETPPQPKLSPAEIRNSMTRDALVSFEDNKPYKTLRRHLAARGLSPEEYRSKWGLPEGYPMAAPSYREARSNQAKVHGFGGRRVSKPAAPEPASTSAPAAAAPPHRLHGLGLSRKRPSAPNAFRPRESVRDPETSARHKRWLAMLSEADWARIRAIARQVNHAHVPATLIDLSAPLRVRACPTGQEARFTGEPVGTLRGGQVAILISELGDH